MLKCLKYWDNKSINQLEYSYHAEVSKDLRQQINQSIKIFLPCWNVWRTRENKSINQLEYSSNAEVSKELRQQINQSNKLKYSYHAEVCQELETTNQSNNWSIPTMLKYLKNWDNNSINQLKYFYHVVVYE